VTRGGLLETLLEMAMLSEIGLTVAYERIPIPRAAMRFAEAFDFDPLKMISSGTLVATVPPSMLEEVKQALELAGIGYADIGDVHIGLGVAVNRGGLLTHYDVVHPEADELARMWTSFHPDEN